MLKKSMFIITAVFILSACAMIQEYKAPIIGDTSKIVITSDVEAPMLGYSTYIYKVKKFRKCYYGLNAEEDTRFMTLDKGNPLVSEFNAEGVNVASGEALTLAIETVAGGTKCPLFVGFTPDKGNDYQIKVLGKVNISPHQCKVELWSKVKDTNKLEKQKFEYLNECLPN
jgi:hypothetical protein